MLILIIVAISLAILQAAWGGIALAKSSKEFNQATRNLAGAKATLAEKEQSKEGRADYYYIDAQEKVTAYSNNVARLSKQAKFNGLVLATAPVSIIALPVGLAVGAILGTKHGVMNAVPALTYSGDE